MDHLNYFLFGWDGVTHAFLQFLPAIIGGASALFGGKRQAKSSRQGKRFQKEQISEARGFRDQAQQGFDQRAPLRDLVLRRLMGFQGSPGNPFSRGVFGGQPVGGFLGSLLGRMRPQGGNPNQPGATLTPTDPNNPLTNFQVGINRDPRATNAIEKMLGLPPAGQQGQAGQLRKIGPSATQGPARGGGLPPGLGGGLGGGAGAGTIDPNSANPIADLKNRLAGEQIPSGGLGGGALGSLPPEILSLLGGGAKGVGGGIGSVGGLGGGIVGGGGGPGITGRSLGGGVSQIAELLGGGGAQGSQDLLRRIGVGGGGGSFVGKALGGLF